MWSCTDNKTKFLTKSNKTKFLTNYKKTNVRFLHIFNNKNSTWYIIITYVNKRHVHHLWHMIDIILVFVHGYFSIQGSFA